MTPRSIARLQLAAAAALFSTGGAAIKAADFTAWQIAGFRSGIGAVAIWLMTREARRGWSRRAALVGVAYAGCLTLFVLANRLTTAANTIFLQSTAPLYLVFLGPWLLREPTRRQDLAFLLAMGVGLSFFFVGTEQPIATAPEPVKGNALACLSGLFWAVTVCGLRWMGASDGRHGSPTAAVVAGNLTALVVALPFALPVGAHSLGDWGLLLYLGVFQIALAYVFVTRAIRTIPALEASLLLLLEPVLNPIWAWLVHGERPGAWALLGGGIILTATTVKAWLDAREVSPRESALAPLG
jgi:drug/metabolite transporter, DME family